MTRPSDAKRLLSVTALAFAGITAASTGAFAQAGTTPPPATTAPQSGTSPTTGTSTAPGTSAATAPAKIDAKKEQSIRELLTLTGQEQSVKTAIPLIIGQYQRSVPDAPAGFWDRATKKFTDAAGLFTDRLVPVYDAKYSQEDLDSMIAFYKSPAGQKMAKQTPLIQTETARVGQGWVGELAQQVQTELQAEMAKAAPPAKPAAGPAKTGFDKRPFKATGKPVKAASGLQYVDMTVGKGKTAVAGKTAVVHYTGTLTSGKKFDSSRDRGQPFSFPLGGGQVIKGWDQGVAGMKVGGRRKLTIPGSLAYGAAGAGADIPPNATLVFDVELIDVQ